MFITDTNILENIQILEESSSKGTMKICGIFQRADEANNNKRIYDKKILEREIERLTESLGGRRLMGELDHPKQDQVSLRNVSHLITNLEFKGNEMIGEAELLNTPAGLTAQALIKGGVKLGISSRGTGSLTDRPDGCKNVNEDFKLITFDLVADPSTKGAFPSLAESINSEFINETVASTMDKAYSEKVFITLLKNKLRNF